MKVGDEDWISVSFTDCVVVVEEPNETLQLVNGRGDWLRFSIAEYADADELSNLVRTNIPAELFVALNPEALSNEAMVREVAEEKLGGKESWPIEPALEALEPELRTGESLMNLARYRRGTNNGVLAVTDARLMSMTTPFLKQDIVVDSLPLEEVAGVESKTGFLDRKVEVRTRSGDLALFEDLEPKERQAEIVEYLRGRAADAPGR